VNDPLARLVEASARLLGVVDETLVRCGAPDRHPIWPLLRSVGLLPRDAVTEVEALSLEAFAERAGLMRSQHDRGLSVDQLLRGPIGWEGAAAEAAVVKLESARAGLGVLTANAAVLAGLMQDLAELGERGRVRLARTLAKVLTSAQAVELTVHDTEPLARARAAADIGAEILGDVAGFWTAVQEIVVAWLARLEPLPAPGAAPATSGGGRLAVEW
jgi:hypothetical protein